MEEKKRRRENHNRRALFMHKLEHRSVLRSHVIVSPLRRATYLDHRKNLLTSALRRCAHPQVGDKKRERNRHGKSGTRGPSRGFVKHFGSGSGNMLGTPNRNYRRFYTLPYVTMTALECHFLAVSWRNVAGTNTPVSKPHECTCAFHVSSLPFFSCCFQIVAVDGRLGTCQVVSPAIQVAIFKCPLKFNISVLNKSGPFSFQRGMTREKFQEALFPHPSCPWITQSFIQRFGYPTITYYWTGLLILDHSYLVGNLTNSKIAETKALEPLKSWHFVSAIFALVNFPTRYEWSKIRGTVQ
jgi:hypothetical protein